ncbi:hypothetical protein MMC17_009664 [Xylographa soralifera]|nr:hypothetical protein [Xylographa soralifera]
MAQAGNDAENEVMGGLAPPLGITPDFVNPYSLQPTMIAVFASYLAITAITTLLRMYTKLYITKTPGWGDYTACIAMNAELMLISACITSILHLVYSVREYGSGDATFVLAQLTFATGGEIASAILCTNLPILPRFFRTMAAKIATTLTYIRNNSKSSFSAAHSRANALPKKKVPLTSWTRFKESAPKIFKPNYLGLETRDLKPGFRTLMEEDLELGAGATAEELEYREQTFG